MTSVNHEAFVGLLKYCRLSDLVKLVILSKECVDVVQCEIDRICELQGKPRWIKRLGHSLIKSVEITIGSSPIDIAYGNWLDAWYKLKN